MQLQPNTANIPAVHMLTRITVKESSSYRPQWRPESGREAAMRGWRGEGGWGGGGEHRKSLTSVLCVLSVATAVSGSGEHKSHQGELSGAAGRTREKKVSKHCWTNSSHTLFIVSWLWNPSEKKWVWCSYQNYNWQIVNENRTQESEVNTAQKQSTS